MHIVNDEGDGVGALWRRADDGTVGLWRCEGEGAVDEEVAELALVQLREGGCHLGAPVDGTRGGWEGVEG